MNWRQLPRVLLASLVLGACTSPQSEPPPSPPPPSTAVPSAPPSAVPPSAVPPSTVLLAPLPLPPSSEAPSPATPPPGARVLHLLSPDMPSCIEMYSVCTPDGASQRCTSAPLYISCGRTGSVPNSREVLFCACP